MRKALPYETCCELVLYLFIENDKLCLSNWYNDFHTGRIHPSIFNETKQLFLKTRRNMLEKEKELLKFGVQSRDSSGILSDDFVKWHTWWNNWYLNLPREKVQEIAHTITPFTGELDEESMLKYRPPGRWQDIKIEVGT
jgi:hypothetical protein